MAVSIGSFTKRTQLKYRSHYLKLLSVINTIITPIDVATHIYPLSISHVEGLPALCSQLNQGHVLTSNYTIPTDNKWRYTCNKIHVAMTKLNPINYSVKQLKSLNYYWFIVSCVCVLIRNVLRCNNV